MSEPPDPPVASVNSRVGRVPSPGVPPLPPPGVPPWANDFLKHLATERSASPYTLRNYGQALAEFSKWHHAERQQQPDWKALQRDDFRNYLRFLGRNKKSRAAIQLRFSALRSFYKFLIRRGRVETSPIKNIQIPKLGKRLPQFLTARQMVDLVQAPLKELAQLRQNSKGAIAIDQTAFARDVAILETIYSCGLRVSELCGLLAQDINFSEQLVRVRGKGKKERQLPIGAHALEAIQAYWAKLGSEPFNAMPVFLRTRTSCVTAMRPICSMPARTCAACRNCSATRTWPPRKSTRTSRPNG